MSNKQKIILFSAIGLIVIAVVVIILMMTCAKDDSQSAAADIERANTLALARTYAENGDFEMAKRLLNDLLIKNGSDDEALALLSAILNTEKSGVSGSDALLEELRRQYEALASNMNRPVIVQTTGYASNQNSSSPSLDDEAAASRRAAQEAEEARRKAQEEELAKASREMQEIMRRVNNLVADGKARIASGDLAGGTQLFNEARRLIPAGETRFESQKLAEMADAFYDYSAANPNTPSGREALANATQYANDAVSKDPTQALPHFILGKIARDANQIDRAVNSMREAARLDQNNYIYQHEFGRVLFMSRRYAEARDAFLKATTINPNFEPSWYNLGGTYRALNRLDDALASYREAVAIKADYFAAHREIGRILVIKGDARGAVQSFTKALQHSPNDYSTLCELGAAHGQAGNHVEAENIFTRALSINPSDPQTNYNMAVVKLELKKNNEAINYAKLAVDSSPNNAIYVYTLGLSCEAIGASEQAITAYKRAATLDSKYLRPRINLGSMYLTAGNYNEAIHYLNEAYAVEPANFEVNNNLGAVYAKLDNWSYSIVHYERALASKSNDATVRFNLARAYAASGDHLKAQSSYQQVLRLAPDNWDAMYELGMTCVKLGLSSEAKQYLQDLISRNPNYSGRSEVESILRSL